MKPLLSLSRMWNTFFTSSALFFFRPTIWKNFLWSKDSAAVGAERSGQKCPQRTGGKGVGRLSQNLLTDSSLLPPWEGLLCPRSPS